MRKTESKSEPTPYPEPPTHLSERSKSLWVQVGPERATTTGRQALLLAALESLDRADQARRIIQVEGLMTVTARSGVAHVHPAVKVERESRAQFSKLWDRLGALRMPDDFAPFG